MRRISLFLVPLLVMSGVLWADSAYQTDWGGGPGVAGPVSSWGDDFYLGTDLDWDTTPGQLKLVIDKGENVVDSSVDGAYGCALIDMDSDNDLDIVGCSYNGDYVHWWRNSDNGETWTEYTIGTINGPAFVKVADIDGDGDRDVVVAAAEANQILWYKNTNAGLTWTPYVLESNFDARQLSVGDFDMDGDFDILGVSSETGDVVWWNNRVEQSLPWIKTYIDGSLLGAYACDVGDMDGDGDFDVVVTSTYENSVTLYTNDIQYTGAWIMSKVSWSIFNPYSIAIVNFDSDDKPELACAHYGGIRYYDYASGVWNPVTIDATVTNVTSIIDVDMDGDGDFDLVSCSGGSSDDVYWFQNLPGDAWEKVLIDNDFQGGIFVEAGDIDGDGVPDAAGTAFDEDRISWWRIGGFTSPGILYSSILEIEQPGYWQYLLWSYEQPYGTSIYFNLRSSNNASAMGSWSANIYNPGSIVGVMLDNRTYLQYKVTLQTTYPYATPSLKDVTVQWSPTGIEGSDDQVLSIGSPNPSFGQVELLWNLPEAGDAELSIYDASGRLVRVVENGWHEAGQYTSMIDGLPSGVYAACLQGNGFTALHRLVILD